MRSVDRVLKPPSERLYGRARGHALRPRQRWLLEHALPSLRVDPADPFAGWAGERWLEVGFGGGEHAAAFAAAHPGAMLVACEVFLNGICSLLSRLVPEAAPVALPANLRLWDEDARPLLAGLPEASLDGLVLLFPDPWPKTRHAKRRFVHPATLGGIARVLRPGGEWRIASDDPTYQSWVEDTFAAQRWFTRGAVSSGRAAGERPAGWPPTRYEAKARAAGRRPLYWSWSRRQTDIAAPSSRNGTETRDAA